ncbi:MAG: hypothetical protein OEV36_11405 [Myxococcales bacterium]|nr:hypothetical protein [Myxococcales bacterium]
MIVEALRQLVPEKHLRKRDSRTTDLRVELSRALRTRQATEALAIYELIERQRPDEPRWSHRKGDLLQKMGRDDEAVVAYERAVSLYAARGFDARAAATAKVMLAIDPSKREVLERVEANTERRSHEQRREAVRLAKALRTAGR